jgi:hypothetical protein
MVSPHHSAKEIMTNLKEGQITSLFQKSLKRVSEFLPLALLVGSSVVTAVIIVAPDWRSIDGWSLF